MLSYAIKSCLNSSGDADSWLWRIRSHIGKHAYCRPGSPLMAHVPPSQVSSIFEDLAGHANHSLPESENDDTTFACNAPFVLSPRRTLFERRNTRRAEAIMDGADYRGAQTSKNVIAGDVTACTCLISSLKPREVHSAQGKKVPKARCRAKA